jgi:hypothetical protein
LITRRGPIAKARRAAVLISLTWIVCLSFSVSSAIVYVQERSALTSGREVQHASLQDAERELREIEQKLKSIGQSQSVAQVEAEIAALFALPVLTAERVRGTVATLSLNCTKHDARTAQGCAGIAKLRTDLAGAVENARLEERATQLRNSIRSLRATGGSSAPDPVGEFWAWLTRGLLSVRDVGFGLPLAFAVMIEMVSAFGPFGIVAFAENMHGGPRRDMSGRVLPEPDVSRHHLDAAEPAGAVGEIIAYIAERTEPADSGGGLGLEELLTDYGTWCKQGNFVALARKEFIRAFDRLRASPELEGSIKKFGNRYFGIALARKGEQRRGASAA